jgi:hypothetical protein
MTELENLEALSGSKPRAKVILASVREIIRDEQRPTAAAVDARCFVLPHWTACGDDEVEAALAVIEAEVNAHVAKLEAEAVATEQVTQDVSTAEQSEGNKQSADVTVKSEPADFGDRDAALARVNQLTRELGDARSDWRLAGDRLRTLRITAAAAIEAWQRGLPRTTFRDALDAVSLTQRLTKQQQMDRTVPGPSAWDRQAFYSTGHGHAPAFVQKLMRGGGNRRGSLPLSVARGPLDTAGKSKMQLRKTDTGGAS